MKSPPATIHPNAVIHEIRKESVQRMNIRDMVEPWIPRRDPGLVAEKTSSQNEV